jgi:RNA polymerase sigma-70 factor (ECF subfamily)
MHDSGATSLSLLERARANEPAAWRRLVELYSPLVFHWCRKGGLSAEDAADVMQDVFHALAGGLGRFQRRGDGDSFRGWLWGVTRFKLADHFRARGGPEAAGGSTAYRNLQQAADDLAPPPDDPSGNGPGGLVHRALGLIRGDFAGPTWQAFWATAIDGRPAAEVAAELGLSLDSVYQARARVLKRLREEFAGLLD